MGLNLSHSSSTKWLGILHYYKAFSISQDHQRYILANTKSYLVAFSDSVDRDASNRSFEQLQPMGLGPTQIQL